MSIITPHPLKRMIKEAGAKRVSKAAAEKLSEILENKTKEILIKSQEIAELSGRRTVMKKDIKIAAKKLGY